MKDFAGGKPNAQSSSGPAWAPSSRESAEKIPFSEFKDLPRSKVAGHAGQFALARIGQVPVIFAQGRVHLYEGHSGRDVTAGVRLLADAGIKRLILTNAAGSVNPKFSPGEWMMLTDHINLSGTTPLLGSAQFIDMTEVYSAKWRGQFATAAGKLGIVLREGVYASLLGPQYETPAEVRMLQKLGADAVGMSTVLEAIQARALGLEVAAFSCITNFAAGYFAYRVKPRRGAGNREGRCCKFRAAAERSVFMKASAHRRHWRVHRLDRVATN